MTLFIRSFPRPLVLALAALGACAVGAAPYSVAPDGATVTDQATALQWARCSLGETWDGSACTGPIGAYTWQNALLAAKAANDGNYLGHSDWRVPNVSELESLMDVNAANPTIDLAAFPGAPGSLYWSSTTYAAGQTFAWYAYFYNGHVLPSDKGTLGYARLVRGGQPTAAFDALAALGPGPGPVTPTAPAAVPTLGELALALLAALLGALGLRQRRKA